MQDSIETPPTPTIDYPPPTRIFVVGSPRSGTTLLQSLLAAHSQVIGFTESHCFDKGFRRIGRSGCCVDQTTLKARLTDFANQNAIDNESLGTLLSRISDDPVATAQSLIDFFDELALHAKRSVWIEKTPDNVFRLPLLEQANRELKFIHIVRRPVDTILSLRDAKQRWGSRNDWHRCFGHWYCATKETKRHVRKPSHTWLSYEDLTSDPSSVLASITNWIGLAWEPEMLQRRTQVTRKLVRSDETWKQNNFGDIQTRSPKSAAELPWWLRYAVGQVRVYNELASSSPHASTVAPRTTPHTRRRSENL